TLGERGVAVVEVQNRVRGWNAPELPAVADAREAAAEVRRRWPDVPLVLLGCSMGARVAARLAGETDVAGVVALTPWWPEPQPGLAGTPTAVVCGTWDVLTPVRRTRRVVAELEASGTPVRTVELTGAGHLMLVRRRAWFRAAVDGVERVLDGSFFGTSR
ncbi:hypothetical protein, partial [Desertihabitans aurantiacus]|uniref:hypothetical protein n=1 Tax=Desertihabitans aurantiacus TaxID=2282477 RepID=UPI001E4E75C2